MKRLVFIFILGICCKLEAQVWLLDQRGCRFYDQFEIEMNDLMIDWDGGCKDGYLTGKGTLKKYKGGELIVTFSGELEAGKYKTFVKWTWPNGTSYEGDLKNNNMSGKGKFIWANGNKYIGDFIDGERTGKGKFIWTNGDIYEGDFVNSVKSGRGKFNLKNGDIYEGDFSNNKFNGWGKIFYIHGDMFEGEFKNGMRNGAGRYDFANSNTYVYFKGTYINDKKNGPGKLFYPDGSFIEAIWKDDQMSMVKANSTDISQKTSPSNTATKSEVLNSNNNYRLYRSTSTPTNSYKSNSDPNNRPKLNSTNTGFRLKEMTESEDPDVDLITAGEGNDLAPIYKWEFKGSWTKNNEGAYRRNVSITKNGQNFKTGYVSYRHNDEGNKYFIDVKGLEYDYSFLYNPDIDHQLIDLSNKQTIFGVKDLEMAFFHAMQYSFEILYK